MKKTSASTWAWFLIPSIIGVILFMVPVKYNGDWIIPIAILANWLAGIITPVIQWVAVTVLVAAALGSFIMLFAPKKDASERGFWHNLFGVSLFWTLTRIVGAVFAVMTAFELGPEAVWSGDTGGLLLDPEEGLVTFLFTIFVFAGLLLPLLMNFGLLEFFGTMMVKIMRPLFKLPGRSSIDALASWVGDGTIGVLLTDKQYQEGHYTKKESAIIATTFSVVSITFSIVIIGTVDLSAYFLPFYGTVILTGLILAFIMPRIYPLSRKKQEYVDGRPFTGEEEKVPPGYNSFTHGVENALTKAHANRNIGKSVKDGLKNVIDMWFGVIPVVMAFGTLALIIAEYTSFFQIVGKPFEPYLALLQIPEAAEAAPLMIVGFADMFLPSILAAGTVTSEVTLFTVAVISVVQLIYMSEVGGLILGSKIPVNFFELLVIFLLRTVIALPIVALIAHMLF